MRDLRYALRLIGKHPWLSLVAVLSLTLGIGANTTIFSFTDALLFRQPAVEQPQGLTEVWTHDPDPNAPFTGLYPLSYLDYRDFAAQNRSYSGIAIYYPGTQANVQIGKGAAAEWTGQLVSANYFGVLGLRPALGRWFAPAEAETAGSAAVVVLSYPTWQQQFGGDATVLDRQIEMNGVPYTVIGVAPRGFAGMFAGIDVKFFAPVTMAARLGNPTMLDARSNRGLFAIGRLKPGVTLAAASGELDAIQHRIDTAHPRSDQARFGGRALPIGLLPTPFRGFISAGAGLLAAVVGLVLLIACANAALVLLVEALGRRREWAIRAALGASRKRLLRQGLVHSLLLALAAGGLGLMLAQVLAPALIRLAPPGYPVMIDFKPDARLLLFSLAVAVVTGLGFGLAPAWQGARASVVGHLKDGTPGAGATRSRVRSGFIVAQVALCVVVLVGAGLCLRSLQHASAIDPGFDTEHLLTAQLDPSSLGYTGASASQFLQHAVSVVERVPGVEAVSLTDAPPLQISVSNTEVLPPGMRPPPGRQGFDTDTTRVGPGYFAAAGTRLLAGRDFTATDLKAQSHLVVINQTLAQELWPHGDAVGHTLLFPGNTAMPSAQIAGVAENGKYRSLGEQPRRFLYQLADIATPAMLVARVEGNPRAFQPAVERALAGMDANLPPDGVQTIQQYMQVPLFPARFTGILLAGFGILALLLAVVGLYGVIAASVAQRTREYGVRMALGANAGALLRLVVGQGLRLALLGVAIGVGLAMLLTRFMAFLLYGLSPLDLGSYAAAAALLLAVTVLACLLPARRATRVDPLRALRAE